jgi:DNA-directed RNA polymerase subunit RPC12/RpoP
MSTVIYRCATCKALAPVVGAVKQLTRCPKCSSLLVRAVSVLTSPLPILEMPGSGVSSYLARLHNQLMGTFPGVVSSDEAFERLTRVVRAVHEPQWRKELALPDEVRRPFQFRWKDDIHDMVVGPLLPFPNDSDWLTILRFSDALLVSSRSELALAPLEEALRFDQLVASRLRWIVAGPNRLKRVVVMFNAVDTIAEDPVGARERVDQLFDSSFGTTRSVCANTEITVYAVPTSSYGFGSTDVSAEPFRSKGPFNVLEPLERAFSPAGDVRSTSRTLNENHSVGEHRYQSRAGAKPMFLESLYDSLQLKITFMGAGIDLKPLFSRFRRRPSDN